MKQGIETEADGKTREVFLGHLTFADLRNGTDLHFTDISTEEYRVYKFVQEAPENNGMPMLQIRIDNPVALNVSKNGHRVWDAKGISHYIPKGWLHLYWKVKEDAPHFVK